MDSVRLSVIVPTYNERDNLPVLLEKLNRVLANISHEILIIDDNSPDGTWETGEKLAETYPAVKVIRRLTDRGLSSAVVMGMTVANGSVFAVMDADLQHDESILPDLLKSIEEEGNDVAVGSRGLGSYGEWSKRRRFVSWVAAGLAKIVLPVELKDPMSGFFMVRKEIFHDHADKINPRGFKILLEFVGRIKGLKIKETGYTFRNRVAGETKLSGSVVRNYLIALYDIRFGKYISPVFMQYVLVGGTGIIVNLTGFYLGELIGLPKIRTGLSDHLDPLYLSVPFGYQLAILSNYFLNNYITFFETRHKGRAIIKGIILFELISLLGLFVQTSVFQLLHTNNFMAGLIDESLRKYVNVGFGIVAATVSNYFLNINFTWSRKDAIT